MDVAALFHLVVHSHEGCLLVDHMGIKRTAYAKVRLLYLVGCLQCLENNLEYSCGRECFYSVSGGTPTVSTDRHSQHSPSLFPELGECHNRVHSAGGD